MWYPDTATLAPLLVSSLRPSKIRRNVMSATTPTAPLTIVEKLEQFGHETLDAVEHAALRVVAYCASTETSLKAMTAAHPLLLMAWDAGVASATAHGIPVIAIENIGGAVLAAAQQFAAGLSAPAPVVPVAVVTVPPIAA
jgi:hypothetical protein